ncbi:MAG: HypC/HybG/HupF family hydrogenase formation chaperone [Thioalkalivibrio sp.]|jgi:hydrogenase expression/formation protein HypC|nr:HypC/HybG/HupF family hydrogenase formation chaperone [Thioalkalivibrio sp.]
MCLALPVEVVELLDDEQARVDVGGVQKVVNVSLVDQLEVGDYVILHVGFAINRLDQTEAERTLELFREMSAAEAES